jgi:hypothetical protein
MNEDRPASRLIAPKDDGAQKQSALSSTSNDSEQSSLGVVGIKLTPSKNNLDAILQDMLEAEDQPIENDEASNAHSDMSSLLPFGNIIPSDCEGSIATGPLDVSSTNSEKNLSDPEFQGQRPNEVYIEPTAASTSYGNYFNRRRTCDQSLSSNESNSLSSILDSIGWTSRKQKVHHSRGLNKNRKGMLYKFLAANNDSTHHERETSHRQKAGARSSNRKVGVLFILLCAIWYVLNNEARGDVKNEIILQDIPEVQIDTRPEGYSAGMGSYLVGKSGTLKADERPYHADKYYEKPKVNVPTTLSFVANPSTKLDMKRETPLLWVVPKSGARLVSNVLSSCDALVIASDYGAKHNIDIDLKVITNGDLKYVNVETFTPAGIAKARQVGLVASKMADVITTPLFRESLQLFDDTHNARAFVILRHPIDRAVSMYERLERDIPGKNMTLLSYARSPDVENNYLVRYLSGKIEGELDEENLSTAKEILKKFVVGLAEDLDKSMRRFERYFGFTGTEKCRGAITKTRATTRKVKQGSEAWDLLLWQNKLDLELYKYAKELYARQETNLF